jgi:hypothetical protein
MDSWPSLSAEPVSPAERRVAAQAEGQALPAEWEHQECPAAAESVAEDSAGRKAGPLKAEAFGSPLTAPGLPKHPTQLKWLLRALQPESTGH